MKHSAYHRVRWADGTLTEGPLVVTTDDNDQFVTCHHLQGEEPATVWVGGTYCMTQTSKQRSIINQ